MNQTNTYIQRINLVINYIREHITEELPLNTLAQVAAFSPFHFHRIFRTVTGETLNDCVLRLRLERAATLMKTTSTMPITQAALDSGFVSLSHFSRAFKKQYGISARQWDRSNPLKERKNGQVIAGMPYYTVEKLEEIADSGEFAVNVRALPPQRLAYIRVFNSYQSGGVVPAYNRLIAWYQARGGVLQQSTLFGMSQDDPEITPFPLCRYDICLTVPQDWEGEGEVGIMNFPACELATIYTIGDIFCIDRAWQYLFRYWLPRSRYQPDNLPAMEIYCRQPIELGWEQYDMECAIPVTTL